MINTRFLTIALIILLQAGCVSTQQPSIANRTPLPMEEPEQPAPSIKKKVEVPPAPSRRAPVKAEAPASPPAVLALMQEAEASRNAGQLDNAAATLERAIRIQPRNPLLWHQLANLRLQQHQPGMAEDLAKKSNVLGKGDRALSQKNWALIAEARRQKGDVEGAAEADAKAGN